MTDQDAQTIQREFAQLRQEYSARQNQFQTRSEQFEKTRNRELLTQAAEYTVDTIVKGAAELQLEVGAAISGLANKLSGESDKLSNLVTAIQVAGQELADLRRIRVAADALALLQQENAAMMTELLSSHAERTEALTREQTQKRLDWEREDAEFLARQEEMAAELQRERELEKADYAYTLQRQRQEDRDEQAEAERSQQRDLEQRRLTLDKDWRTREATLDARAEQFEKDKARVEAAAQETEEAVRKAREEGIRQANADAKVKSDLLERDWEASKQSYELQIESLQNAMEAAETQVAELQTQQLRVAEQTQALAARAFRGSEA